MRLTTFPIDPNHSNLWMLYKKHVACFWTPEEIDYSADAKDWENLTTDEKFFIEHILAFFASSDNIVMENLINNFCQDVDIPEAASFYQFQAAMENIHAEVYSQLIESLIPPHEGKKKKYLFNAVNEIPCIRKKADWARKYMDQDVPFLHRLIAFAVVEGIFFSGSFCAIFWLKSLGKMVRTLGTSNELIARDEALHCEFAIALFHNISSDRIGEGSVIPNMPVSPEACIERPTADQVYTIVRDAVELEKEFVCEALPCRLIGMNAGLMQQYIEFVADRLVLQLGYPAIWNSENPFEFMKMISIDGKTNFFEKYTTEYSIEKERVPFNLDNDF
uniref:Ribonucleoside-diphosphate reductase small chain n=1 Tax=Megaviridae environmental sample TaxID=1737588 RepID=A0A5J6VJW1_9VIRU|nr:MAG: ribonucleotide reductase, small chain [Megaviridae environmental sample]